MKTLLKIVLAGLAVFIAVAIVQEWDYFSSAWFGIAETPVSQDAGVEPAAGAVRQALTLMAHLYTSGGDPRFAERMPVTPEILEEIQSDIAYLERNRRRQDSRLQQFELLGGDPAGKDRLELRTREFWIHRLFWADGSGESDPPRSVILYARYRLMRENKGWRIYAWESDRQETE